MNRYPIKPKTPQEGKCSIDFATALKWRNEAFYEGFMVAHYETADEWEKATVAERIYYACMAIERCARLRRETPPEPNRSEEVVE